MKRKILVALLIVASMTASLFAFSGCGGAGGDRQVPVYQGMSITNANTARAGLMSLNYLASGGFELLSADNGSYEGDHTDRNDTIDEENPYPDNGTGGTIEEEIKSSLNVIGSPEAIYYAEPYQDIYINIHIDNPDSFEIMSFTLNGKKYSSYMFEDGSDMETIVLKYNVGDASGIVEYTIDAIKYIDGTEIKDVIIDGNKTVMAGVRTGNQVSANISDVDIAANSLSFKVNVKDNNSLVSFSGGALKAVLYNGSDIIAERDLSVGNNSVNFNGLDTNTLYQYAVVGYYDDLSGVGFGMNILYKDAFYTDSVVLFDNITVGQESISFGFSWHEDRSDKTLSALKLYKSDTLVKDISVSATSISELLSNTSYKLVAEYFNGSITEAISIEFTTRAKTAPSFILKNENVTMDAVTAGYDISDPDSILSYYTLELYKGDSLVSVSSNKEISFGGLTYYTEYTLKFTYKYDLNDGDGEITATYNYSFKTSPYIDINECKIANTSAVSEGETIFMSLKLDNPIGMSVESVVINGKTYNVTGASTKNKIFVEIVYNGQFAGGITNLKVDKVNAKIDNTTLSITPKTELSDSVFINGKLEVLKIEFVNDRFEPIEWAFRSDAVYLLITLNNPTGYNIDSVTRNGDAITPIMLDESRYYYRIAAEWFSGWYEQRISAIFYSNAHLEKKLTFSDMRACYYQLSSNEIKYISSPNDLLNMGDGGYYELAGDIDLVGLEWNGEKFAGVFDAKGYAIKNMSFVGTVKNTEAYLGLFKNATGIIKNLNIVEATIIAEVNSDDLYPHTAYLGAVVARANGTLFLRNCTVDKYSILTVKNNVGPITAGGIIGEFHDGSIMNCTNEADVSANSTARGGNVGGIVGAAGGGDITSIISNCTNNGSINVIANGNMLRVGGIVGYNSHNIISCTNNGEISATVPSPSEAWPCPVLAGGIVGDGHGSAEDCTNNGSIFAYSASSDAYAGGVFGQANSGTNVISCINNADVSADSANCQSFVGGIASVNMGSVIDCVNNGKATSNPKTSQATVGGIVANNFSAITGCVNNGDVRSNYNAGGIVGWSQNMDAKITSCINNGNVTAGSATQPGVAGGIVGYNFSGVADCMNNGSVSAESYYETSAGGIAGANFGVITNCVNSGSVSATSTTYSSRAGGIAGYLASKEEGKDEDVNEINCYSRIQITGGRNGKSCTTEDLNSKDFYTGSLGWSEDVWDLSDLDVENGKCPKLK